MNHARLHNTPSNRSESQGKHCEKPAVEAPPQEAPGLSRISMTRAARSPKPRGGDTRDSVAAHTRRLIPVAAVESVRKLPTRRAQFRSAKLVYVMDGAARVETACGTYELSPGSSLALGAGRWCSLAPASVVRVWTVYVDEVFLREQIGWVLPIRSRVLPGMHPLDWSGAALVFNPGLDRLRETEPVWRQMSVLCSSGLSPERVAARAVALFTQTVELAVELLVDPASDRSPIDPLDASPILGNLTSSSAMSQAAHAAEVLRRRMAEPWTVDRLAGELALSRTHLTRLFVAQHGVAPIRFLTEIRLTEFSRLVEETDLTIATASQAVGWKDSRIATAWFRRRFGASPSEFRRSPHPEVERHAT